MACNHNLNVHMKDLTLSQPLMFRTVREELVTEPIQDSQERKARRRRRWLSPMLAVLAAILWISISVANDNFLLSETIASSFIILVVCLLRAADHPKDHIWYQRN